MKTIWIGKSTKESLRTSLRSLAYHLLVDVVPIVLLLILMACAMALVSSAPARSASADRGGLVETNI